MAAFWGSDREGFPKLWFTSLLVLFFRSRGEVCTIGHDEGVTAPPTNRRGTPWEWDPISRSFLAELFCSSCANSIWV